MRLLTAGSLVRARQGEPKIPKSCIVTSGFFHRGIIPLMTLFFLACAAKKIAVAPLDESGRCYAAVRFYIFFILWVIVKHPTMSLAFSIVSRQRQCELTAARLLIGSCPCAAGGRYSKGASRKKQGAVRSAASEQRDYVFDRAGRWII